MPKYIANGYLVHKGKVIQTGDEVDLTDEQANRLGAKVTPVEAAPEKPVEEKTVAELKEQAKQFEIEGYNSMNKGELIEALHEVE